MNTVYELVEKYRLAKSNAKAMISGMEKRIGTENGDYRITDITYIGDETKVVEETCRFCGEKIYRDFKLRRNKWSELQRECECQKRARSEENKIRRIEAHRAEIEEQRDARLVEAFGRVFGDFVVIDGEGTDVVVQCMECGHTERWCVSSLLNGRRTDYLCHTHRAPVEKFTEDYIGRKNNYLTVVGITRSDKDGRKRFICRCDCGKEALVKPTFWEDGTVVSCGCYQETRSIGVDPRRRINTIWRGMKRRCYCKTDNSYKLYGAKGVEICPEWLIFENFYEWSMKNDYDNTKTIDRIDCNGNYEPQNCRWTTYSVQNRNKRPRKSKKYYEDMKNGTTD